MSSTPFQFPPPPPPPPRRGAHNEPAFYQSNHPYTQPGRGRGRGSGSGQARGSPNRPYGQGRANYRNENERGGYGRGRTGTTGAYGGNYGFQQHPHHVGHYGQIDSHTPAGEQSYTTDWTQATRGGTTPSHGFHHNGPNGTHFPSLYRPPQQNSQHQNVHPSTPSSGGPQPPRKRPYSAAFTKPAGTGTKPKAAPAVPSFNAGIPLSPPTNTTENPSPKPKKPRKHNQLGLTPVSQDHEPSSDDENEETRLASAVLDNASLVQFEYKGRIATLRTPAEIAAWIAERKKNYPTLAKADAAKKEAAEKKRKWQEAKKKREETAQAARLERDKAHREELRLKALESKKKKDMERRQKKVEDEEDGDHEIRAKKARIKAERLRLKADMAELKVLEAEAAAKKARKRRSTLGTSSPTHAEAKAHKTSNRDTDSAIALEGNDTETATEGGAEQSGTKRQTDLGPEAKSEAEYSSTTKEKDDDEGQISDNPSHSLSTSVSISNSSVPSDVESTSSSASSTSSSLDSTLSDSDADSAPEQTTSKRLEPTRVPPPPRRHPPTYTNHLCRSLLATGHCKRGDACQYSHDLPDTLPSLSERKAKLKDKRKTRLEKLNVAKGPAKKERRKGLWQVMVDKEQEEERKHLLRAIIFMGEKGMLGEDETKAESVDGAT